MKNAYVDISFEALADLFMFGLDPHNARIVRFEQSPKYENCVRFHVEGNSLPVDEDDNLHRIKLMMTKEWFELADNHFYQKAHLEIVEAEIDED